MKGYMRIVAALLAATLAVAPSFAQRPAGSSLAPLDASEPIRYYIASGEPESGFRDGDAELARLALDAWAEASQGTLEFEASAEPDAIVRIYFVPAYAGQYGEMRPLDVNGRRGAAVYIRPDISGYGRSVSAPAARDPLLRDTIVYLTCLHELGHALGLSHTDAFDDIMYLFGYGGDLGEYFGRYRRTLDSRDDIGRVAGLSARDVERLHRLYNIP